MSRCLNLPSLRRATMARAALASPGTTPFMCVPRSLYIDMSPIVSADALIKPYNSASAELSATTVCFAPYFDKMRSCNCVSSCCAAARSSATCPNCVCERFKLARRFLKIVPQLNPGSVLQIPPQSHHLLPICCCWRGHVTCQLLCTIHDVSPVDGKKIGSCFRLHLECNTSIIEIQQIKRDNSVSRNPASREISASTDLCGTHVCVLHIQLVGRNVSSEYASGCA